MQREAFLAGMCLSLMKVSRLAFWGIKDKFSPQLSETLSAVFELDLCLKDVTWALLTGSADFSLHVFILFLFLHHFGSLC